MIGVLMKLAQKYLLVCILLFALISTSLGAATVVASYKEEFNTTIHNSTEFGIQSTNFPVALHVGTLLIETEGGGTIPTLYGIQLRRSGDYDEGDEYKLQSTKKINYQDEFGAQLIAKTTFGNKTIVKTINWGNGRDPLMGEKEFESGTYPIKVEFYLGIRNIHNAGQAAGVGFQFEDDDGPNLGKFKIRYRTSAWSNTLYDIPFAGGESSVPYFSTNYNEGSPNSLNGKLLDKSVFVSLSIDQETYEQSINLADASGNSRAKVGQARLTLSGFESPSPLGVTIVFTDGNGSQTTDFRLKHNEVQSFISFSLYLGGEKVNNGGPTIWDNLSYGNNIKALHVGDTNYQSAVSAMGGKYSDTITVNITPLDTNLIGQ